MDTSNEKTPEAAEYPPRLHLIIGARQPSPANMLKARRKLIFKVEVRPLPPRFQECNHEGHAAAQDQN